MKNKYLFLLFGLLIYNNLFAFAIDSLTNKLPVKPIEIRVLDKNFKEKYQDDIYNYKDKDPSLLSQLKLWVLSLIRELFHTTPQGAITVFTTLRIIFYLLIVTGVVYFLSKTVLNKQVRWLFNKKDENNQLEYSNNDEKITNINFETLIESAIQEENYRLAIRFYYLWLLKKLDQASIIKYDPQKTNLEYQQELLPNKLSRGFEKASYYYAYIWYGEFTINKSDFTTTSLVYLNLINQIDNG